MLNPQQYLAILRENNINFFTGVPDSLLKNICACITDNLTQNEHIIAANEGGAVGLAIGHHLASGQVPLVYMQNSGLGNIVNPLMSLASPEVYAIPMLLMIGWRGRPGIKDEPQHVHQGRVTTTTLDAMEIPYTILSEDISTAKEQTQAAITLATKENKPVALLIQKGLFDSYNFTLDFPELELEREEAIIKAASCLEENAAIVSTTGMASRELFEYRADSNKRHETDFLTVGGMGHASQIALGIALKQPKRPIYCFDGDGAALMHLGSMAISGTSNVSNFVHILLNNGAHESVGGQPTIGFDIDFPAIAKACGYTSVTRVKTNDEITKAIKTAQKSNGASFIEIQVKSGHRSDIGRPTTTPKENKLAIMNFLSK